MKNFLQFASILLLIYFSSCKNNNEEQPTAEKSGFETLQVDNSFNYSTTVDFDINIMQEYVSSNLPIEIYSSTDFDETSLLGSVVLKGSSTFTSSINIERGTKKLYIKALKAGVPQFFEFDVSEGVNYLSLSENFIYNNIDEIDNSSSSRTAYTGQLHSIYGNWDNQGLPDYLIDPDTVSQALMDDIDASLPERRPVPTYNPSYLKDINYDTKIIQDADVWITFVHEGAGYRNTLAYYTYPTGNPPQSTNDIDSIKVVFPNVSYLYAGGKLKTGDKVFLGRFDANTSIGWVLIPNGWDTSIEQPVYKNQVKYSNYLLNNDSPEGYKQHMVALKDTDRNIVVLGFEDLTRPGGDNDFNDCMFYLTANPFTISVDDYDDLSEAVDTDGDGLFDHEEDYPNDSERAFNLYINNKSSFSTYGFEDLWPAKGDYDFNDLVIGVKYKKVLNANYFIREIVMDTKVFAIGGYYRNGFGIEFPFNASLVNNTTGQVLDQGVVTTAANGTEVGSTKASVIFFENAYSLMSSDEILVNVKPSSTYVTPHEFTITLSFNAGQLANSSFTNYPNPFIFVDQERGREVHLPNYEPTALANQDYFKTSDDNTDSGQNIYYKTSANHPWAINVVANEFKYPYENVEITSAYNHFKTWAESSGGNYSDWYKTKSGYKNDDMIFQRL
ncbi:LruC domain-containing protein [Flammeovirga yaeyamensis]|uniref:LruC domain-containing protein n=1 Tax=Flammeovirga yaeyamensis TaxID=367791 RepID=A0AAX1N134_9BACT|nr:LruC domain-containing protein [Flammeovirga yaeyamensis]MBB3698376.1 LruC domain-containing protein [Flammeovirga yaeyamensis]NMF34272.1 LruC domain-containing protein [Flammeovirga yaeyamensis]QWG01255.1 LruC domain-containing protein [Flammeovirga yaeyamensis]